jgi:hypothetical protein
MPNQKLNQSGFIYWIILISLVLVVAVVGIVGYLVFSSDHATPSSPRPVTTTTLVVSKEDLINSITNTKPLGLPASTTLLSDIKGLSPVTGSYACPDYTTGIEYLFKFSNPNLNATIDVSGCEFIIVNHISYHPTSKFWSDLQKYTGWQ